MTIADLNGDKRGDLILALPGVSGIGVLLSGADGTPGAMQQYPVGVGPVALAPGDFNGDGKIDVAVAYTGSSDATGNPGNVGVLLGKGDGTFLASVNLPLLAGQSPVSITAADFDGDGRLDLAVATKAVSLIGPGKITIYAGKGDGTFAAGRDVPLADPTNYPEFVTSADLNGDGKMDLVALLYVQNPVWVVAGFLNRGGGNFTATATTPTEFGPITAVAKDFNGDGKVDLVVAHCCGLTDTTTLLGNGDGTFQPDVNHLSVPSPVALATADFDGDGMPDLIMGGNRDQNLGGVVAMMIGAFPAPSNLLVVSAADDKVTNIAADSIASAFGNGLALTTELASSAARPTTLAGTSVQIRDSAGVNKAGLLAYASSTQVNFAVPPGLANGAATVTIQPQGGTAISTTVNIATVAPAIFSLNAGGLAAALVFRVKPDGSQSVEQVYQVNGSGQVVARPIDLGPVMDQVYLLLFGTGIRQGSGAKVKIGGVDAPVSYAGPQGQYSGFDQVNALLPRSLAGKGSVAVQLMVSGVAAGTSVVTIQ